MSIQRAAALALAAALAFPLAARAQNADAGTPAAAASENASSAADDDDPLAAIGGTGDISDGRAQGSGKTQKAGERGSLSEELLTLQPSNSIANPIGPTYANNLSGVINLNDKWSLDLGFLFSIDEGAPPPPGSNFPDSGGHVSLFTVGADWDSGNHWSFDLLSDLSPKSTNDSSTTLQTSLGNGGTSTTTDVRLNVVSSNIDLQLGVGYDTNGDSNAEWMFVASITGGGLDTDQKVTTVQDRATGRNINSAALQAYCTAHPKICGKALTAALKDQDDKLDSSKLELGTTLTLFTDTDITLTGDYFLYLQDPSQVGYFNVAAGGRSLAGGAGIPIAPLRVEGRLDLLHRFGKFSLKLWAMTGEYAVDSEGMTYGFGAKAQYRFSHTVRVWLGASVFHDVDDTGDDLETWGVDAGFGYRF